MQGYRILKKIYVYIYVYLFINPEPHIFQKGQLKLHKLGGTQYQPKGTIPFTVFSLPKTNS